MRLKKSEKSKAAARQPLHFKENKSACPCLPLLASCLPLLASCQLPVASCLNKGEQRLSRKFIEVFHRLTQLSFAFFDTCSTAVVDSVVIVAEGIEFAAEGPGQFQLIDEFQECLRAPFLNAESSGAHPVEIPQVFGLVRILGAEFQDAAVPGIVPFALLPGNQDRSKKDRS